MLVSVSLRSIIHSYKFIKISTYKVLKKFPSPYGVSFILIMNFREIKKFLINNSFRLLTEYHSFLYENMIYSIENNGYIVSVSLRSIIHSYKLKALENLRYNFIEVSVSLRSIIHSYYY